MFSDVFTKQWTKAATIRAIRTFAQTFIAMIGTAVTIEDVSWKYIASSAVLSAIVSLMTSVAGLPEVKAEKEDDEKC